MSTPDGPETADDGHTWLSQEYAQASGMWGPPDPQAIAPEYPAWRLPDWYAGRTGLVQVPGQPGQPGVYQYVWSGWLPWQAMTDRFIPAEQWPDAEQLTVGDMQAELWPPEPEPAPEPLPLLAEPEPTVAEATDAPPLTDPTDGR